MILGLRSAEFKEKKKNRLSVAQYKIIQKTNFPPNKMKEVKNAFAFNV